MDGKHWINQHDNIYTQGRRGMQENVLEKAALTISHAKELARQGEGSGVAREEDGGGQEGAAAFS